MTLEAITLGPAPGLVARAPDARGTLLLLHGYAADALANHRELALLRRAGWTAIGLDAPSHWRRHDPERDVRWAADRGRELSRLALGAAAELPDVVDAMLAAGFPQPYGIVGVSLGAISVWAGLVEEPRLIAAAALLGSPELPHPDSPHRKLDAFVGRSILAIQAEHDEIVPVGPTRALVEQLDPQLAVLRIMPGVGHLMPEPDWWMLWGRVLEWLDRTLAK